MKLTKEQLKEAVRRVYELLCSNTEEGDILDEMGLTETEYEHLKSKMFEDKTEELRAKPIEHTYVEYIISQYRNITDLNEVIENYRQTKQATAIVGAIRVRSDIADKIITRGQEFGIIKKVPNRNEVIAGLVVQDLSNRQLKQQITGVLSGLNNLISRYGDSDMIDVSPGEIHRGKKLPEAVLNVGTEDDYADFEPIKKKNKSKKKNKRRIVERTKEI